MESETAKNAVLERLETIRQKLRTACESAGRDPQDVTLMAVTKTVDPELINTAVDAGVHVLGENRVQEFRETGALPRGCRGAVHRAFADE